MDPQQKLFIEIKKAIINLGYSVYDGELPPDDTPYPFVYLADSQQTDDARYKDTIMANVYQAIHIWHSSPNKRGTISTMAYNIKGACRSLEKTTGYRTVNINQQIMNDNTTNTPLLHCVLEFEFRL